MSSENQSSEGNSSEILSSSEKLNVAFKFDPTREIVTLKVAMGAPDTSMKTTPFGQMAEEAGIDISSKTEVVGFVEGIIKNKQIDMDSKIAKFEAEWRPHEERVQTVFSKMFSTPGTDQLKWSPGNMTAYLTLAQRCPYNTNEKYYFLSIGSKSPIEISLHEIMHFYSHQLLQPKFVKAGIPEKHQDFKEALTVLLNEKFGDIMEYDDAGYPQHQKLRSWIKEQYSAGQSVVEITDEYISNTDLRESLMPGYTGMNSK